MGEVWKEAYEIVGDGVAVAEAFFAEQERQTDAQWALVKELKASGYRPGHDGGIRSLFFKERPECFRQIGRENKLIECVPHKGSKAGKELAEKLRSAPRVQPSQFLADEFGWDGRSPMDGRSLYFASASRLELPSVRYLLRLPRELNDGFVPPDTLRLIPMSEYLRAFEDHNAALKTRRTKAEDHSNG